MGNLGRRDFLKGAAALAASSVALGRAEAAERAASAETLRGEHVTFTLPDLDPAHDGLRVAQLTDLHVGTLTPVERIRAAIDAANAFEPDLVVLTGDYVAHDKRGIGLMREQLGGLTAPTVAVLGNHDHWVDAQGAAAALAKHGYAVLQNENTTLTLRGEPFTVLGVDDLVTQNAEPAKAMKGARPGSRIVLAHAPKTADILRLFGKPALVLTGHTHGCQVNIPGLSWFVMTAIVREPYIRGTYQVGKVQLYVNRGVGNSAPKLRVNSPPEVTLAVLRSSAA